MYSHDPYKWRTFPGCRQRETGLRKNGGRRNAAGSEDGEGGSSQGMQVASRSCRETDPLLKGKEVDSPLEAPEGKQPCQHLD